MTVLGAVAGAGKSNWTGSNDPTNLREMDPQIRSAVAYLTIRNQIMQYLPEALRLLAAHKRALQQSLARPAGAGYQDGMIVRRAGESQRDFQVRQMQANLERMERQGEQLRRQVMRERAGYR
jgi:hypothetical protein